jgi:hypothetical protein
VVLSGLSYFKDEPLFTEAVFSVEFRSQKKCRQVQAWVEENTDSARVQCFKK